MLLRRRLRCSPLFLSPSTLQPPCSKWIQGWLFAPQITLRMRGEMLVLIPLISTKTERN
jgi:hypothetical protein